MALLFFATVYRELVISINLRMQQLLCYGDGGACVLVGALVVVWLVVFGGHNA